MNREEKQLLAEELLETLMQKYPKDRAIEMFEKLMVFKEDVPVYNPYTDTFVSTKKGDIQITVTDHSISEK